MDMQGLLKNICSNKYVLYIFCCLLMFAAGFVYCYQKYVPAYKEQVVVLNAIIRDYQNKTTLLTTVKNTDSNKIAYVPKKSGEKTDVEIKDMGNQITVKYNGQETILQSQLEEAQKFEYGKLVIDRTQNTVIDMTEAFNKVVAAEVNARNNNRTGKVDFGALYNTGTKDAYAGIRYNAKMFDFGAYHGVGNSDIMIGVHGKF